MKKYQFSYDEKTEAKLLQIKAKLELKNLNDAITHAVKECKT